ncbi:OmpA family protein [Sphingobacterium pedocola]|uniref:OmpA-like domain-containing protein n=1 Tax=Sphingobacterium pedocola TaxID=2082722 RepID=A0ABR9TBC1_9SPHI|nr:OmpA family protein [Sphingobacterium pedocola]MBE8721957.1 hypothetical protein [Sphingobacterium pedocola]
MTKEQAYERLELPVGTDLQTVRRRFAEMHNDYRMRIENAPTPRLKQTFERGLEELKEAYALLNESNGMDDTATLPRTGEIFTKLEGNSPNNIEQLLTIFGLTVEHNPKVIHDTIQSHLEELYTQYQTIRIPAAKQLYQEEIQKAETAKQDINTWLTGKLEQQTQEVGERATESLITAHQYESVADPEQPSVPYPQKKGNGMRWGLVVILLVVIGGIYYLLQKTNGDVTAQRSIVAPDSISIEAIRDSTAWQTATAANHIAAYEHYINTHSEGGFRDQAQQAITALQKEHDEKTAEEVRRKQEAAAKLTNQENTKKNNTEVQPVSLIDDPAREINKLASEISFQYDSSVLTTGSHAVLDKIASYMREQQQSYDMIVHLYEGASEAYTMKLAKDKGDALKRYLINSGIAANRLNLIAYGNSQYKWKGDMHRFLLEIKVK